MKNFDLLREICLENGVSGDEGAIRDIIVREIAPHADEYFVDSLGNLIVFKKGAERPKTRVMAVAHMDEVGFIVTHVTEKGYLGFEKVGGIDDKVIHGINVTIGKNKLPGVIGVKPIHLLKSEERRTPVSSEKLFVDFGASGREDALKYVSPGDYMAFSSVFDDSFGKIRSKALDDRVGCAVLIDLIKSELEYDAFFAFTVQEEIGLRGAAAAAYTVDPQAAVVVEATTANDLPGVEENGVICKLGEGPAISFMDKRTVYDREYYDLALSLAKDIGVKAQIKKGVAGANDSGAIQISRGGVRTIAVSVPCRYLHAPCGMISQDDLSGAKKLTASLFEKISSLKYR